MRNLRLTLSYDGTDFHGWQTQPGLRTVQQTLEDALAALTRERVRVNASGRTDTGVHAVGQVVNSRITTTIPAPGPTWLEDRVAALEAEVAAQAAEMPIKFVRRGLTALSPQHRARRKQR
jgi:tRNA pseudouridine(38-40) synthase